MKKQNLLGSSHPKELKCNWPRACFPFPLSTTWSCSPCSKWRGAHSRFVLIGRGVVFTQIAPQQAAVSTAPCEGSVWTLAFLSEWKRACSSTRWSDAYPRGYDFMFITVNSIEFWKAAINKLSEPPSFISWPSAFMQTWLWFAWDFVGHNPVQFFFFLRIKKFSIKNVSDFLIENGCVKLWMYPCTCLIM